MHLPEARQVVERIRGEFEASRESRLWPEYVRALKLISQVVFTRSAGFVLELLQNAEDAGRGLDSEGFFEIRVSPSRVRITHNGRPFNERDAEALCGIRSSKKPEQGTLGYLGIGFKSVFKVTDAPELYSGDFRFKFDKHDPAWADDPGTALWHVTPIWLDAPPEDVDHALTTFILPLREKGAYKDLVDELRKLDTGLFLFLRWLKRIVMINEETGEQSTLQHAGEAADGITVLKQGRRTQRFKVFRKTVPVPEEVKLDELTRELRAGVNRREIAIAFGVGEDGRLAADAAACAFGGVYSFIPLGEARSGARFRIQADFLVHPGRDTLNHEACWNRWLVDETANLAKEALTFFAAHETWRFQFLPVFEFTRAPGIEAFDALFGPRLVQPLQAFLGATRCLPTGEGGTASLPEVVRITEEPGAVKALVSRGVLRNDQIAEAFGGKKGLKPLDLQVVVPRSFRIPEVNRWNLLKDHRFLQEKAASPQGPEWFRRLYLWLQENPWRDLMPDGTRSKLEKRYHHEVIVLANDGCLHHGGEVLLPTGLRETPLLRSLVEEEAGTKPLCHPGIVDSDGEIGAAGKLFGFLTGKCGVQKLDAETVCKRWLVPLLQSGSSKPDADRLVEYTRVCMENLGYLPRDKSDIWVLTRDNEMRPAGEVLFSKEYKPAHCWETMAPHLPNATFLSPAYLEKPLEGDEHPTWRRFFKSAGVKTAPDNGVEEVAVNIAQAALGKAYRKVSQVQMRNLGYDLEVETHQGELLRVEVKGLSAEGDVELTPNETQAAERYKDKYLLCVVATIPLAPHIHIIPDPTASGLGTRYALRVAPDIWRAARWPCEEEEP